MFEQLEGRLPLAIDVNVFDNTNLGTAGSIYVTGHGIPGNTPAGSAPQELRVVGSSGSFVQGAVTIDTASSTGTTAKIATTVAHQLKVNDHVYVSGVGVAGYNGVFTVTGVDEGSDPRWFEYTVSSTLADSSGGAAYLPPLLSTQNITAATATNDLVTVTLQSTANLPLNSAVFISGLDGAGAGWNGVGQVAQNASTNPALKANQFQIQVGGAAGTATVTNGSVRIVSVNPISLANFPGWTAQNRTGKVTLDQNIEGFSSQLVQMVTPAGQSPYPLGIVPGTANLTNLGIPPFAVGQQTGTSVADILEFYYAGATGNSTFDLSGVDGFALPLTLSASSVSAGPQTVGLNTTLPNLSREQIGTAFKNFIANEPADVQETGGNFLRLLYTGPTSTNVLTVAAASQPGTPLTGVSLEPALDPGSAAHFTGSISETTLSVLDNANNLAVNKIIVGDGVKPNTYITHINQINENGSGTFTVSQSQEVDSRGMTAFNATGVITATKASNGLVPGQSFTVTGTGSAVYDGKSFMVQTTTPPNQFTFLVPTDPVPVSILSATVTPSNAGVIATSPGNLVVTVTSGMLPLVGSTVRLSGTQGGTLTNVNDFTYTVADPPSDVQLPENAVYLASQTGQNFTVGDSTGGGTLSTPVFVDPPPVPDSQFYAITAPKDWLANQSVATANTDPMAGWWDSTLTNFFKAGNYLNVSIGTYVPSDTQNVAITGVSSSGGTITFAGTNNYSRDDVVTIAGFPANSGYNQTARIVAANGTSFSITGTNNTPVSSFTGTIARLNRPISYTGTFGTDTGNGNQTGFHFTPDHGDYPAGFTSSFWIYTPTPQNVFGMTYDGTQSQKLANATWVWAQANIPGTAAGTVWDQIVQAFCRGVALDGVLTAQPTLAGQSNAAWTTTDNWYTEHMTPAGITSVYCPFSKFLHFGTLTGGTDRSGTSSIYTGGLAYGFSEDEVPFAADGLPGATVGGPSKMDGTVPDNATMTLIVNPWGTNEGPTVNAPASFSVPENISSDPGSALVWPASPTPFADPDSQTLTVTLEVSAGTINGTDSPSHTGVTVGGTATARTFAGTITSLNAYFTTKGQITYTPPLDDLTSQTLTTRASDGIRAASATSTIDIVAAALPQVSLAPTTFTIEQDGPRQVALDFTTASFTDPANLPADTVYTVKMTGSGTISATPTADVTVRSLGGGVYEFAGALTDLDTYFKTTDRILYIPPLGSRTPTSPSFHGTRHLEVTLIRPGPDHATSDPVRLTIVVQPNQPPVIQAPLTFAVTLNVQTPLVWPATMTPFADASAESLTVTLAVTTGVLAAASSGGVTVSGSTDIEKQFVGSVAALNAYFKATNISYTATGTTSQSRPLTITASDGAAQSQAISTILVHNPTPDPNGPPTINRTTVLEWATENQWFEITYDQLVAASGASDPAHRTVEFTLVAINSGTLQMQWNGIWIAPPTPRFGQPPPILVQGGTIRWKPPANTVSSTGQLAFTVGLFDLKQRSLGTSQVLIKIRPQ